LDQLNFHVKGSSKEPYEITFIKDGDSLAALCTCPAGQFGNLCKHRVAILDGDASAIVSDNADDMSKVVEWLPGTDVEASLLELRQAEKSGDASKDDLLALKKKLAKVMNS